MIKSTETHFQLIFKINFFNYRHYTFLHITSSETQSTITVNILNIYKIKQKEQYWHIYINTQLFKITIIKAQ